MLSKFCLKSVTHLFPSCFAVMSRRPSLLHDPMPPLDSSEISLVMSDPSEWARDVHANSFSELKSFRGEDFRLVGVAPCSATCLEPTVNSDPGPAIHLMCLRIQSGVIHPWDEKKRFRASLPRIAGQLEWTRHILKRYGHILRQAGIYEAVMLSLFSYTTSLPILRALIERWNYVTNTFFFPDRELSPNLLEIEALTGLPIIGEPYEEYRPRDVSVFARRDGEFLQPLHLREVFQEYIYLSDRVRGGGVPLKRWVEHFTDKLKGKSASFHATPLDPWGDTTGITHFQATPPPIDALSSLRIDDLTHLTAFLSWWLCYFVLPFDPIHVIRPTVFVMASRLAMGTRLSLAVPVLANIYSSLRELTTSTDPCFSEESIPVHFLMGWFQMHMESLYPIYRTETPFPAMIGIAGQMVRSSSELNARHLIRKCGDTLSRGSARRWFRSVPPLLDDSFEDTSRLAEHPAKYSFLVSIRRGYLPLRIGDRLIIEPYSPHRCGHQFGFDQHVSSSLHRRHGFDEDLQSMRRCWASLFRCGSGAHVSMPSRARRGLITAEGMTHHMRLVSALNSFPVEDLLKVTCKRTPKRKHPGDLIGREPLRMDFRGLDSTFSSWHDPAPPRLSAGTHYFHCSGFYHHPFLLVFIFLNFSQQGGELAVPRRVAELSLTGVYLLTKARLMVRFWGRRRLSFSRLRPLQVLFF